MYFFLPSLIFFNWTFSLFTFQMFSSFQVFPLETPYSISPLPASMKVLPHPPTSTFPPWQTPTGPRAAALTDDQQDHPLLHMRLEPWFPPCVLFSWWSSPQELLEVWPVDTVASPMGLQIPSAPSVPSPSGTPNTVQWLAVSIHLCICQALTDPLRRQIYQTPSCQQALVGIHSYVWVW